MDRLRDGDRSIPVVVGGYPWRRERGLETLGDRALRFLRPGCLVPLPEDLLPRRRRER